MREPIPLSSTVLDALVLMSEGNPGAASVLALLSQDHKALIHVLTLDDMNMRGPQIWAAYKYHCGGDIEKLKTCLETRDRAMVEKVNEELAKDGFKWKAVTDGASYMDPRPTFDAPRDAKKLYPRW